MTPKTAAQSASQPARSGQQAAFLTLNTAIQRLAVRRERPVDPRNREEFRSLVDEALEAYRNYMRLSAT